jgi:Domain of unknown function (DUF4386)
MKQPYTKTQKFTLHFAATACRRTCTTRRPPPKFPAVIYYAPQRTNYRRPAMPSAQKSARTAGALYLLTSIFAGLPLLYIPGKLIVDGDASSTAQKILAHEFLFRAGLVSELAGAVLFIFMVRALYRLLHQVNQSRATLMVTLVLLSVPITFVNVLNETAALALLRGANFLAPFDQAHREALALFFLGLHGDGVALANIFWGLWLLPFGALVIQSKFLPRFLGVWLILDGLALVAVSLTALLIPAHIDVVNRVAILPELGELATMLWLLIKGVNASTFEPAREST